MINLYGREIINNAIIILCLIAMVRLIFKMKRIDKEFKEAYKIKNWTVTLRFALFIESLCIIMLIFNLVIWKSIVIPIGILGIAFVIQYDKVLKGMCND